jgi:hypothetical protein
MTSQAYGLSLGKGTNDRGPKKHRDNIEESVIVPQGPWQQRALPRDSRACEAHLCGGSGVLRYE